MTRTSTRATTAVLVAGVLTAGLAGCSTPKNNIDAGTKNTGQQTKLTGLAAETAVAAWGRNNTAIFKQVSIDISKVLGSYYQETLNTTQLTEGCTALKTDVASAKKTALPAPATQLQAPLKAALTLYGQAADKCLTAIQTGSLTTLKGAANDMAHGAVYANQIKKLLGVTDDTSTAKSTKKST